MARPPNIYSLDTAVAENSPVFADLISAASPTIAPNGAIGENTARSENVSFQRNADYTALLGLLEDSAGDIAAAISAMQYGFNQEQADGSFSNPQLASSGAYNNASADAFFLQSFAQICLALKNSPLWPTFSSQILAFGPQFSKAMSRLASQASILSSGDAQIPNHLLFDALAFELGGDLLNNNSLNQIGANFVNQALAMQSPAGYFIERGGWDSSYNGTSMLDEEQLITYSNNPAQVSQLAASLSSAATWEETRIATNGEVSIVGNTRTGGQENDLNGAPKTVDYLEVGTSLLYAGAILNSAQATSAGNAVAAYGLMQNGGVAQPMRPVALVVIRANSAGIATGDDRNDELVATGPGQTLINTGGGGEDVFYIGPYADTTIVTPGTGLTEILTSASDFTLPTAVDDLVVSGGQNHVIVGNGRNNYIVGSNANDTIHGGGGDVVIKVGTGGNLLTGGGQYDVFDFPSLSDHDNTITDFQPGHDVIDLRSMFSTSGWSTSAPTNYVQLSQQGANAIMSINPSGIAGGSSHTLVTLNNVTASALVAGTDYLY